MALISIINKKMDQASAVICKVVKIYRALDACSAALTLFPSVFDQTFILVRGLEAAAGAPVRRSGGARLRGSAAVQAILPLFPMPSFFSPILFSFYYRDFLTSEEASYETGVIQTRLV